MQKIKLTKSQQSLLTIGSCIYEPDGQYYCYLPFWFKSTANKNVFELYNLDDLPKDIVDIIKKQRL